jgi:hypothetical protein
MLMAKDYISGMGRPRWPASCALVLSCLVASAAAAPQQTFDQPLDGAQTARNASYDISIRLDPAGGALRGVAFIRWRNISNRHTRELWLHVPPGAGITRLAARHRAGDAAPLAVAGSGATRVALPWEVPPYGVLEIEAEWRLPIAGTAPYAITAWFPKVAVLEDTGWRIDPGRADFGSYDVQLTLPGDLAVEATGVEVSALENADGSVTRRFRAEDVRNFAWTAARRAR